VTQWHPLFAELLRPLLEGHYEVQTNVPVGDAPRSADIVLIQRVTDSPLPFKGIWRWLTRWNVLEYKGPSVSARGDDLDLLVELGLGIQRRLESEVNKVGKATIRREDVSFWYLTNRMGKKFLAQAADLLGPLDVLEKGVRRVRHMGRAIYLVAGREVPIDHDSIPLHLLLRESMEKTRALALEVVAQPELFASYAAWLAALYPMFREEIQAMARKRGLAPVLDLRPLINQLGIKEVIQQIGLKETIEQIGLKAVIKEAGLKEVVSQIGMNELIPQLTAEQLQQLRRHFEEMDAASNAD